MINLFHFKDAKSDKIWGYIPASDNPHCGLTFWGRARGSMAFKAYDSAYNVWSVARSKRNKGYKLQDLDDSKVLLPPDFEGQLMLAKLGMTKF